MSLLTGSIVLYKSGETVKQTVRDFLNTSLPVKLFLIDNSPTDALRRDLSEFIADERVEYLFNNGNLGYGAAHNIALRKVLNTSAYHVVLNPDISFKPGVLEELLNYLELNADVGLVTPKVVYPSGAVQYVCKLLPSPLDLFTRRFLPNNITRRRSDRFEMRFTGYNKEFEAPYIHGCFMFLRTDALKKAGMFDERFFMYPEDIDLTRRIHRHYKTMFYPYVQVVHKHGRDSYKKFSLFLIHIINTIRYFNKWGWLKDYEREAINKKIVLGGGDRPIS